jgi:pyridoxal phosphate enzyme (YggS family)
MPNIFQLRKLSTELALSKVKLVAVSKTYPINDIQMVYDSGHKIFGENKVQEMLQKSTLLPTDIEWHLIGHLQSNKVKYIAPFVHLIHSVDNLKLLHEINKQGQKNNRIINCLLQIKITPELTKTGFELGNFEQLVKNEALLTLPYVRICGLMGMASFSKDKILVAQEFAELKKLFDRLKAGYFTNTPYFSELSMGMSGDYTLAISQGSTMVRIGSLIFGNR